MHIDDISHIDYRVWNCCHLVDIVIWFDLWLAFNDLDLISFHVTWFVIWHNDLNLFVKWFVISDCNLICDLPITAVFHKKGTTYFRVWFSQTFSFIALVSIWTLFMSTAPLTPFLNCLSLRRFQHILMRQPQHARMIRSAAMPIQITPQYGTAHTTYTRFHGMHRAGKITATQ